MWIKEQAKLSACDSPVVTQDNSGAWVWNELMMYT